jgi:hypothetical protein
MSAAASCFGLELPHRWELHALAFYLALTSPIPREFTDLGDGAKANFAYPAVDFGIITLFG